MKKLYEVINEYQLKPMPAETFVYGRNNRTVVMLCQGNRYITLYPTPEVLKLMKIKPYDYIMCEVE